MAAGNRKSSNKRKTQTKKDVQPAAGHGVQHPEAAVIGVGVL